MEPEASFYSDCPTDVFHSFLIPKTSNELSDSSRSSESSDANLLDFLSTGNCEAGPLIIPSERWEVVDLSKYQGRSPEFASVKIHYGIPLIIRFYNVDNESSSSLAQIGGFSNVPLEEVRTCYEYQRKFFTCNEIRFAFEGCNDETVHDYESALSSLLDCVNDNRKATILKCAFIIDDCKYAGILADIIGKFCNTLVELNIGEPRDKDVYTLPPDQNDIVDSDCVEHILLTWLPHIRKTLRCLRIYYAVRGNQHFSQLISSCSSLNHLTLSKIINMKSAAIFINIQSFEYDGQDLAYTDEDLLFMRRITHHFPSMNIISFQSTIYDPVIFEFLRSRALVESGKFIHFYQPVQDLKKLVKELQCIFPRSELSRDEQPKCIAVYHPRFFTKLVLYRAGQIFQYPI